MKHTLIEQEDRHTPVPPRIFILNVARRRLRTRLESSLYPGPSGVIPRFCPDIPQSELRNLNVYAEQMTDRYLRICYNIPAPREIAASQLYAYTYDWVYCDWCGYAICENSAAWEIDDLSAVFCCRPCADKFSRSTHYKRNRKYLSGKVE